MFMPNSLSGIFVSVSGAIVLWARSQCQRYLLFLSFIFHQQPLWFPKFGEISVGFAENVVARFGRLSVHINACMRMKGLLLCLTLLFTPLKGKSHVNIRSLNIRGKKLSCSFTQHDGKWFKCAMITGEQVSVFLGNGGNITKNIF